MNCHLCTKTVLHIFHATVRCEKPAQIITRKQGASNRKARMNSTFPFAVAKGQLISKCLFDVFNFLQKTNENESHSSKSEFVRSFFGGNFRLEKSFRFCLTFKYLTLLWFSLRAFRSQARYIEFKCQRGFKLQYIY